MKLKIVDLTFFCFPSFYPSLEHGKKWEGIFAHRQYVALQRLGQNVIVITPKETSILKYVLQKIQKLTSIRVLDEHSLYRIYEGIEIYSPYFYKLRPYLFFRQSSKSQFTSVVTKFLINYGARNTDILFAQWFPQACLTYPVAQKIGLKTIFMGIGEDITHWPKLSNNNKNSFTYAWCNSDIRAVVANYLGDEANKIANTQKEFHVFYSSVDDTQFYPVDSETKQNLRTKYNLNLPQNIIVTIGSPIIRKGWLDLLNALENIDRSKFYLIGINSGPSELDLDAEITSRGLEENWLNVYDCPPGLIHEYLKLSDIFCLPSHWEGLANALIEAMACGLPVITTDVNGHPEIVRNGINGLLVQPSNMQEITVALKKLLNSQELRYELGKQASKDVLLKPGTHLKTANQIIDVAKNLI